MYEELQKLGQKAGVCLDCCGFVRVVEQISRIKVDCKSYVRVSKFESKAKIGVYVVRLNAL